MLAIALVNHLHIEIQNKAVTLVDALSSLYDCLFLIRLTRHCLAPNLFQYPDYPAQPLATYVGCGLGSEFGNTPKTLFSQKCAFLQVFVSRGVQPTRKLDHGY